MWQPYIVLLQSRARGSVNGGLRNWVSRANSLVMALFTSPFVSLIVYNWLKYKLVASWSVNEMINEVS